MKTEPLAAFTAVDPRLFFTRNDKNDPRLGERARALKGTLEDLKGALASESAERRFVIAGYADDEGIRINGGRLGAAEAPTEVRRPFYKMTPSLFANSDSRYLDLGDLSCVEAGVDLAARHATAEAFARATLDAGASWVGIGGGHDYGYPDGAAFCSWCEANGHRPLVLNFDAHLDVRPTSSGLSSGTPFFRLLERFPNLDFAEIGIQRHCNSRAHLEWAKARGARVLSADELEAGGEPLVTALVRKLGDWLIRPRPVFLSVDIDAFSSSIAPGCSQSWATGIEARDFFPALELLKSRLQIRALGLYEVSPPLDHDHRTAKLAAQILHRVTE